ncbi:MAG: hypothetical protein QNJ54_35145, partial [Prochloraceae cyanobacterium]|nr:hypothetical protein [Prochloraceae cyanobacterium]
TSSSEIEKAVKTASIQCDERTNNISKAATSPTVEAVSTTTAREQLDNIVAPERSSIPSSDTQRSAPTTDTDNGVEAIDTDTKALDTDASATDKDTRAIDTDAKAIDTATSATDDDTKAIDKDTRAIDTDAKAIDTATSKSEAPDSKSSSEEVEPDTAMFQAVGIIVGQVNFTEDGKATVTIARKEYPLFYTRPHYLAYTGLQKEIETTNNNTQRLIVYPRITHFPSRDKQAFISFQLVGFDKGLDPKGISEYLKDNEFKLCGLWRPIFLFLIRNPFTYNYVPSQITPRYRRVPY